MKDEVDTTHRGRDGMRITHADVELLLAVAVLPMSSQASSRRGRRCGFPGCRQEATEDGIAEGARTTCN